VDAAASQYVANPWQQVVYTYPAGTTALAFRLTGTAPAGLVSPPLPQGNCYLVLTDADLAPNPGVIAANVSTISNELKLGSVKGNAAFVSFSVPAWCNVLGFLTDGGYTNLTITGVPSNVSYTGAGSTQGIGFWLYNIASAEDTAVQITLTQGAANTTYIIAMPGPALETAVTVTGSVTITGPVEAPGDAIAPVATPIASTVFSELFNGATWDRAYGAPSADAQARTGFAAIAPEVWNGTTYDRLRSLIGDAQALTGIMAAGLMGWNGTTMDRVLASIAADAQAATGLLGAGNELFNGTNWDRQRNNQASNILPSAARTAGVDTATQINYNARGVIVFLVVTAASGSGGLSVAIQGADQAGNFVTLHTIAAAITATGTYAYELYPGVVATAPGNLKLSWSGALPRSWRVEVTVGDSSSYTYSVNASLIL